MIEEKPPVVAAGEEYKVKLRYLNKGNSTISLSFAVQNAPVYPVEISPLEMTLQPGASQVLSVSVKTKINGEEASAVRHILRIAAVDKETLLPLVNNTIVTEILPAIAGKYDRYHRIPANFSIITGGHQPGGNLPGIPGLQLKFSGSGSIDEQGKNQISLSFLTPNLMGRSYHDNAPSFELEYRNDFLNLNAGSRNMILSPLTKRWYGYDNIKLQVNLDRHSLGIINPGRETQGFYYRYQLSEGLRLQANYLLQPPAGSGAEDGIYSLQAEVKPFHRTQTGANSVLNLEYAYDQKPPSASTAYRLSWQGYGKNFRYALGRIQAAPDFSGAYRDLESTSGSFSFSVCNTLQGSFFYHKYRNNLNLNPARSVAREEETYLANFTYKFSPHAALLLSARTKEKQDRLLPARYDYSDSLTRIGWQQQFSRWRFQVFAGAGLHNDRRAATGDTGYKTYALNGDFTPNLRWTYQFFLNTGDQNYARIAEARSVAGFKANLRLQNNLRFFKNLWPLEDLALNFEYQKRNFLDPSRLENDYLSLHLAATWHRFSLTLKASQLITENYTLTRLAFFTAYHFPYNIPTVVRKETGVIEGQVFDGRTPGVPLPNVIVKTNGISVITNEEGRFVFSSLPPGVYAISIDKSRAALGLVPGEKLPLFVEVKKGETTGVRIDLFPGAKVAGKTLIKVIEGENGLYLAEPPAGIPQSTGRKETKALPNILVELSNGAETFRQVTPVNGEFSFTGLRPGKWTLKVYEENLPAHYYFEAAKVQLDLEPGVTREFVFTALPRFRGIQIVDEGELTPGKPALPAERRLGLEDLFAVEYYQTAASPKTLQKFLEETGLLQKNYLYHDRYFTDIIYEVKEGDSLTRISEKFNIPLQRIIDLNFLGTTGVVEVGTILIIPVPAEFIYTVAPGETLADIAKKHGTTVEILLELNNIDLSVQLQGGEVLVLPGY